MKNLLISSNIKYWEQTKNLIFCGLPNHDILNNFNVHFVVGGTEKKTDEGIFKFVEYNSFDFTAIYYAIDNKIDNFFLVHDTVILTEDFLKRILDIQCSAKLCEHGWSSSMGNYTKESIEDFKKIAYDECYNKDNSSETLKKIKEACMKYEDFFTFRNSDMHPFPKKYWGNTRNTIFLGNKCQEISKEELKNKVNDIPKELLNSPRIVEYCDCGLFKLKANHSGANGNYRYEI
jgi:hypothetical protein